MVVASQIGPNRPSHRSTKAYDRLAVKQCKNALERPSCGGWWALARSVCIGCLRIRACAADDLAVVGGGA